MGVQVPFVFQLPVKCALGAGQPCQRAGLSENEPVHTISVSVPLFHFIHLFQEKFKNKLKKTPHKPESLMFQNVVCKK